MPGTSSTSAPPVIDRLTQAVNDHDLDAMVGCFAPAYRNETPAHPTRGFRGREQVRRNWTRILAAIPDVTMTLTRVTVDGDTVWTEQEHRGTRADGSSHVMRGVVIFGIEADAISWARFYLEPVSEDATTVDEAIARQFHVSGAS
jgi:ketosteroid isomerase-like protein